MDIFIGILVAVLAVGFVCFVIAKSIIDKKNGKSCCCDCSKCSAHCNSKRIEN